MNGALAAIGYGTLMSIQSMLCAQLTTAYGNWFSTVTVHLSGLIVLTPFFLTPWGRRKQKAPWYWQIGGVIGVLNVLFCNYSIVRIGMTNSNVLMLLGEILFSALLDQFGLFNARKRAITPMKTLAILVMMAGCAAIVLLSGSAGIAFSLMAAVASLMRGVCLVIFRQLNGQLSQRSGNGYSTWMNYATGFSAAILVFAVLGFPMEAAFPSQTVPFWTYLCGVIGCLGIYLCNVATPKLSALTMSVLVFVTETVAGLLFDSFSGRLSIPSVVGCAVVAVGMAINLMAENRKTE